MKASLLMLLLLLFVCPANAQVQTDGIERAVNQIIAGKQATVGVAILFDRGEVVAVKNDERYPTMSVFKFHVAIAALKKMEREHIPLDRMICIDSSQMRANTYSPLRDKYPNRNIRVSYRELIRYTISLSDNNTCDLLIDFVGGIEHVGSFIRTLGIGDFDFSETEHSMHEQIGNCYNNWSTPLSMVTLLKKVYTEPVLSADHLRFLKQVMIETSTGADKIKAGLPANVVFGHKTGSSDRTPDGVKIGDNDAGVISLPDGRQCYIAVFIKDSKESDAANARIMAEVAGAVCGN